jgi:hypothetical protein
MKSHLTKIAASLILAFAASAAALADPINGSINFAGGVNFDTTSANTATGVTGWVNPTVQDASGDFATFVNPGDAVSFPSAWSFNSGAVAGFWSVGGFTFDLISSTLVFQNYGIVAATGTGTVSHDGFDSYVGDWSFSSQNPAGKSGVFSFSGGSTVPDGGTTAALLGLGLVGMSYVARRRTAA